MSESPAAQRRGESRRRILDAAIGLVAENGFGDAQMSLIARRAGIGVGSIYLHFGSQDELFGAVYDRVVSHELTVIRDDVIASGDRPLRQLATAVHSFCERSLRAGRLAYALLVEPAPAAVGSQRLIHREAFRLMLAELVTAAIDAGEVPEQDVGVASAAVLGIMTESLVVPLSRDTAQPRDALLRRIVTMSVAAVAADG